MRKQTKQELDEAMLNSALRKQRELKDEAILGLYRGLAAKRRPAIEGAMNSLIGAAAIEAIVILFEAAKSERAQNRMKTENNPKRKK